MSPIITIVVWLATTLAVHGFGLLALWLRLRWQAQQEQVHRQYVVAIARALPEGSRIDEAVNDREKLTPGSFVKLDPLDSGLNQSPLLRSLASSSRRWRVR